MTKNDIRNLEILEFHEKNGVEIPYHQGVIIEENVTVGKGTKILPNTMIFSGVTIGENCIIGPNTLIKESVIGNGVQLNCVQCYQSKILDNASIGPFVHIRPNSVIGESVHLGNFVEVKNSDIDEGTKVSHLTYVGDSDVGKRVNFGCGTVTVNYDGKAKHRTTIGDDCFIGCNTNLIAPVTLHKGAYTAAGSTITENIPADSLGIARARQINKVGWREKNKDRFKK